MCGRFTQNYTWEEVYAFLKVFGTPRNLRPHYNIAPTMNIDVIRLDREGRRELVSMHWGLVPYLEKEPEESAGDLQRARRDHADRRLFPLDHRDWQPHGDEKRPSRNAQV